MTIRTTAAWDRIRAADPMASTDVAGAALERSAQDLSERITPDVTAEPDVHTDVVTLLDIGAERGLPARRHGFVAGLAAAVAVLLVVATVLAVRRHHRTQALSPSQQSTGAGYSAALLAELPRPAGPSEWMWRRSPS